MTELRTVEALLDALAPPVEVERAAWEDVLARAEALALPAAADHRQRHAGRTPSPRLRRRRFSPRRRALVAVALALLAIILVAAVAYALGHPVVDFHGAPKAPPRVVEDFATLDLGAPPGMSSDVLPNQTRRITSVRIDGERHVLWVAPTKKGGFCHVWTNDSGGCWANRREYERRGILIRGTWAAARSGKADAVTHVSGQVIAPGTDRVEVAYEDGEREEVRLIWVSEPIDAGFFYHEVPAAHRRAGHGATAILALDKGGKEVAREDFRLPQPADAGRPTRLPDGHVAALPANAEVENARKLVDVRAENGSEIWMWEVPTRDAGRCLVSNRLRWCRSADADLDVPIVGAILGGEPVLYQGQVRSDVARVELRYEDGARERVAPVEGVVLHEIRSAHYGRGHRLALVVAYGRGGDVLARERHRTEAVGVYPCRAPVDLGSGGETCR